jgi:hypothetical protein
MSHPLKRQCQLRLLKGANGQFSGLLPPFPDLQTHSSLHPVHKPASGHPDIGQRKQRDELCGVLGKPPVAHFDVTELALDNPKRMLHLGPHAGFELFGLFVQRAPGRVLLRAALARAHRHMPIHASGVGSFAGALVARISKDNLFFTVQQRMPLGDIIDVSRRSDNGVHQTGLRVHPNMGFHAEVPLVALLNLVHLGVTLTGLILGRARCSNQGGIHHGARLEQQAVSGQLGVDDLQNLWAQRVLFQQMTKSQDADPVRNALGTADASEVAVEAGLEQGFFGPQVRQAKPLLQAVNAQHQCKVKWRASRLGHRCVQRYERQQIAPRHDLVHFFEQDLLARAPGTEIKAEVYLFHAVKARNLRASIEVAGKEF